MSTEIAVKAQEFGLEESKANEMVSGLQPILAEREILAGQYSEIIKEELTEDLMVRAKKLRLLIVKNRTQGVEKWHKVNKEFYLAGGRFVDAVKNKEVAENNRMEETLMEIEKHFENLEKERIQKLKEERTAALSPYVENASLYDLGNMTEFMWENLLEGSKLQHAKRIEDQRIAEEARIEREKAEAAEREAQRIENERLKAEAVEREAQIAKEKAEAAALRAKRNEELRGYIVFIRDYNALLNLPEAEYQKEFADIKKGAELQWEHDRKEMVRKAKEDEEREDQARREREEAEAKAAKEREVADAMIAKERAEKAKIEAELQAKKDAEAKAEADRLAAIEAEAKKGDAAKVKDLIADLDAIANKYAFKAKKNQVMYSEVQTLIGKVIAYIQK